MLNNTFLHGQENPFLYMVNYLLTIKNTTLKDHVDNELEMLKKQVEIYKEQELNYLQKLEQLERRNVALERQISTTQTPQSSRQVSLPCYSEQTLHSRFSGPAMYVNQMGTYAHPSFMPNPHPRFMVSVPAGSLQLLTNGFETDVKAETSPKPVVVLQEGDKSESSDDSSSSSDSDTEDDEQKIVGKEVPAAYPKLPTTVLAADPKDQTKEVPSADPKEQTAEVSGAKEQTKEVPTVDPKEQTKEVPAAGAKEQTKEVPSEDSKEETEEDPAVDSMKFDDDVIMQELEQHAGDPIVASSLCLSEESEDDEITSSELTKPDKNEAKETKGKDETAVSSSDDKTTEKVKGGEQAQSKDEGPAKDAASINEPARKEIKDVIVAEENNNEPIKLPCEIADIMTPQSSENIKYNNLSDLVMDLVGDSADESDRENLVIDEAPMLVEPNETETRSHNSKELDEAIKQQMNQSMSQKGRDDAKEIDKCLMDLLAEEKEDGIELFLDPIEKQLMAMETDEQAASVVAEPAQSASQQEAPKGMPETSADKRVPKNEKPLNRSDDISMEVDFEPDYEAEDL